jgi:predicted DNA-binding transcriptional regulator AlpA
METVMSDQKLETSFPEDELLLPRKPVPPWSPQIPFHAYPDDAMLRRSELARTFSCGERTVQRMVQRHELPPPVRIASKSVWVVGALKAWFREDADRRAREAAEEANRLRKRRR